MKCLLIASLFLCVLGLVSCETVLLETEIGKLFGIDVSPNVVGFRGVPYAVPPIGENRWKKPILYDTFSPEYYFNFTLPGNRCYQKVSMFGKTDIGMSESCLFLNIYIPSNLIDRTTHKLIQPSEKLNVMVFIHGGAFVLGSGNDAYISAEDYAKKNVILISINYRLGVFGFLSIKDLELENSNSGFNFGLHDQRMAIHWIKKYIHNFGGDAKQITLFGESAGAMSIILHLTSDESHLPEELRLDDLKGAIIQSGADVEYLPCSDTYALGEDLKTKVGCTSLNYEEVMKCLREVDSESLLSAFPDFGEIRKLFWHTYTESGRIFFPCRDSTVYSKHPRDSLREGNFNKHPNIIVGTTKDEGTLFTWATFLFYSNLEKESAQKMIEAAFFDSDDDDDATKLVHEYIHSRDVSGVEALAELVNDAYFQCAARSMANWFSKYQPNTYKYLFDFFPSTGIQTLGAFHAVELAFVFHHAMGGHLFPSHFNESEEHLSLTVVDYWTNFALTGNPSPSNELGETFPRWPKYTPENPATQRLSIPVTSEMDYRQSICSLWEKIYPHGLPHKGELNEMLHEGWSSYLINEGGFLLLRNLRIILYTLFTIFSIVVLYCLSKCFPKKKVAPAPQDKQKQQ